MKLISKIKTSKNLEFQIIIIFILLVSIAISNILNRNLFSEKYNDSFEKILSYEQYHITSQKLEEELRKYKNEYNCEISNNLDERHRLRWLSQLFWLKVYEIKISIFGKTKIVFDLHKILVGLIIFLSYLFIISIFNKEDAKKIIFPISGIFVSFFLLTANSNVSEINYSILEFFLLSAAFYSIFKKLKWFFLLICILAPFNRESGFILPIIFLIFHPKEIKFFILVIISTALIYFLANFSTIKCLLTPGFLYTNDPQYMKFSEFSYVERFKIIVQDYFLYILILMVYWKNNLVQKKILLIISLYTIAFIVAAPFQHSIIKILYIPSVMIYVYSSTSNNFKYIS